MNSRPAIFIGSSSEGLSVAKALQAEISDFADAILWTQDVFRPSLFYLESLTKQIETSDFGVLVLTPDDVTDSRGVDSHSPRDNVVFELGLFIGHLGRHRCVFVYDSSIKLPSDLLGLAGQPFQPRDDLRPAMGPIGRSIELQVQKFGLRPKILKFTQEDVQINNLPSISGKWAGYSPERSTPDEQTSTLTIYQVGSFVRANIVYKREDGERVFALEGRFTGAGHLVLFFQDVKGPGFIVGTFFLHLRPDLKTFIGRSLYYNPDTNDVISKARRYNRV